MAARVVQVPQVHLGQPGTRMLPQVRVVERPLLVVQPFRFGPWAAADLREVQPAVVPAAAPGVDLREVWPVVDRAVRVAAAQVVQVPGRPSVLPLAVLLPSYHTYHRK